MGFALYIVLGYIGFIFLYLFLYLVNRLLKLNYLGKAVNYLANFLFWNGLLRLFIEIYSGMALASVLNTYTVDWQSPFKWVSVSNYSGLISLIIIVSIPILLFLPFYCRRRAQWNNSNF